MSGCNLGQMCFLYLEEMTLVLEEVFRAIGGMLFSRTMNPVDCRADKDDNTLHSNYVFGDSSIALRADLWLVRVRYRWC